MDTTRTGYAHPDPQLQEVFVRSATKPTYPIGEHRKARLDDIRWERNQRLKDSDIPMMLCNEGADGRDALMAYRWALRNLPLIVEQELSVLDTKQAVESYAVTWPTIEERLKAVEDRPR